MSYNIIPKNTFNFYIDLSYCLCFSKEKPYISHSFFYFLQEITNQIKNLTKENYDEIELIKKNINYYEFLLTNISGYDISVSKVKPGNNMFFELLEISQICNLTDMLYYDKKSLNIGHFTFHNISTEYFINISREDFCDKHFSYSTKPDNNENNENNENKLSYMYENYVKKELLDLTDSNLDLKLDLIFFEIQYTNTNSYIKTFVLYILIILKNQNKDGMTIIKLDNIFYRPIIELIYLISCLYDKVHMIKPLTSNITSCDKYLICKNFCIEETEKNKIFLELESLFISMQNLLKIPILITSIMKYSILPYYFINKMEELNSIFGEQQLEALVQIINIYKNKSKEEKLELLKKNHIQKCIQWCEKNQIPHNKFCEKSNIFTQKLTNNIFINDLISSSNSSLIEYNNDYSYKVDNKEICINGNQKNELFIDNITS